MFTSLGLRKSARKQSTAVPEIEAVCTSVFVSCQLEVRFVQCLHRSAFRHFSPVVSLLYFLLRHFLRLFILFPALVSRLPFPDCIWEKRTACRNYNRSAEGVAGNECLRRFLAVIAAGSGCSHCSRRRAERRSLNVRRCPEAGPSSSLPPRSLLGAFVRLQAFCTSLCFLAQRCPGLFNPGRSELLAMLPIYLGG